MKGSSKLFFSDDGLLLEPASNLLVLYPILGKVGGGVNLLVSGNKLSQLLHGVAVVPSFLVWESGAEDVDYLPPVFLAASTASAQELHDVRCAVPFKAFNSILVWYFVSVCHTDILT